MIFKKLVPAFIFSIFLSTSLSAQLNSTMVEAVDFKGNMTEAVSVQMEPEKKAVEKSFEKYLKKNHDVKLSGGKVMVAEKVKISQVSGRTMDLFVKVHETKDHTYLQVFGRFGYDIYLTQDAYPQEFKALESMVDNYLHAYLTEFYQEKIEDEQKELEKIVDDKADAIASIEKLESKNKDAKEEIEELQGEIEDNESEIESINEDANVLKSTISLRETELNEMRAKLQSVQK